MFIMRKKRTFLKVSVSVLLCFLLIFSVKLYMLTGDIPDEFYIAKGIKKTIIKDIPVSLIKTPSKDDNFDILVKNQSVSINPKQEGDYKCKLKLFGLVPIKDVMFKVMPNIKIIPGGNAIGIKLHSKGVLVIDTSSIEVSENKNVNIAEESNIKIGDKIIKVNGKLIKDSEELIKTVDNCNGNFINLQILRENTLIYTKIKPVLDEKTNKYKIGIWVRDKTSGIGTMTFYDPMSGRFAALGHPIMDADTGITYSVDNGLILKTNILAVKKSKNGEPGELEGIFEDENKPIGTIEENNECGIYGKVDIKALRSSDLQKPMQVAYSSQVQEGPAKILCTLDQGRIEEFNIQILKINRSSNNTTKNMIIEVTDPKLIQKTGGIVQGMSGSPIIQNNKIIGAVTHVFVNDSRRGFGIFSELMVDKINQMR